jgi:hypothetical protein
MTKGTTMKATLFFWFALSLSAFSQSQPATTATTTGKCSVSNTGSNSTITINCGDNKTEADAILKIVKTILANQLDTNTVLREVEKAINSLPRDRVMSQEKLAAFTSALGTANGSLGVVPAGSSDDIFPLAHQICDAAQSKGWGLACPTSRNSEMGGVADVEGLKCYSSHWSSPDGVAFKKALTAGGLSCDYIPQGFSQNGVTIMGGGITILIGRQPKPSN